MMTLNNWSNEEQGRSRAEGSEVVVGLFQSGEDAHRAILQLQAEGFSADQIGAAFGGGSRGTAEGLAPVEGKEVAPLQNTGSTGAGSGATGARSDASTVTPAGLATGAGTSRAGLSRPMPEIPTAHIPRAESVPVSASVMGSAPETVADRDVPTLGIARGDERSAGLYDERAELHRSRNEESWWEKLKHVFGGGEDDSQSVERQRSKERKNFGTGEGHLDLEDAPARAGSPRFFEYSDMHLEESFSGMGIPAERARYLSRELGRGGAIVTVRAGMRMAEAERVLEANHAAIRQEGTIVDEPASSAMPTYPGRVELFGEVLRVHRGPERDAVVEETDPEFKDRRAS